MTLILVVDDEPQYRQLMEINLQSEGYQVISAANGVDAVEMVTAQSPDLVLLDVMMPKMDGFTTCERIREFSTVPVIMITARTDEKDRVQGLNVGADDYVVKPFSTIELLARVRAVLRRAYNYEYNPQEKAFTHGNIRIDFARAEVWKGDKPLFLSATEYRLLLHFAHNLGQVLTAEDLLTAVWGNQYKEDKEILWVSIARLRQKLEDDPHKPQHIVTRTGLGYLMPPVET